MSGADDIKGRYAELGNYIALLLRETKGDTIGRALAAAAHAKLAESYSLWGIKYDWNKLDLGGCYG